MTTADFKSLKPGDVVRVIGSGDQAHRVVKKTSYGWQVRCLFTKRLGKAINANVWERI